MLSIAISGVITAAVNTAVNTAVTAVSNPDTRSTVVDAAKAAVSSVMDNVSQMNASQGAGIPQHILDALNPKPQSTPTAGNPAVRRPPMRNQVRPIPRNVVAPSNGGIPTLGAIARGILPYVISQTVVGPATEFNNMANVHNAAEAAREAARDLLDMGRSLGAICYPVGPDGQGILNVDTRQPGIRVVVNPDAEAPPLFVVPGRAIIFPPDSSPLVEIPPPEPARVVAPSSPDVLPAVVRLGDRLDRSSRLELLASVGLGQASKPRALTPDKPIVTVEVVVTQTGNHPDGRPRIEVAARPRLKRDRIEWRARRYEGKYGVRWIGVIDGAITATFGTLTEMQDFVEALAWSVRDRNGLPAMLAVRSSAFRGQTVRPGDVLGAVAVNINSYNEVFAGVVSGEYEIDIEDAMVNYFTMQHDDKVIGQTARHLQAGANAVGWASPVGLGRFASSIERDLYGVHSSDLFQSAAVSVLYGNR